MKISIETLKMWIADLYINNRLLEEKIIELAKENEELKKDSTGEGEEHDNEK